ncbi:MFS general substrate transporter [Lindgomyces ingoldianus]|uniref:MFS general substrate transporter n=1 Tax=Lindgomyces ingoldianus TaxID=673940 RepID=A0ACB6R4A4_9PLEO|nr:MFS general substrate transporter [Lindgomyces ingoldianus]KAF2473605.1 MFS general substrate transporter [Lindgomyces ingoldianus]
MLEKNDVEMIEVSEDKLALESQVDPAVEKRMVRKIDIRLLPITALIYLLCYLDRSNIGNAKILNSSSGDTMVETNNMTNYQFTVALMVFLVAYSIFEAPSNLALKVISPNKWIGFLVIAFGALCAGIAGTHNFAGVTALRFFLGAAEAGSFPGLIFYFSLWYKQEERATRIAAFLCSATLAGAFGGALAYSVGHMNGAGGLEGWRWLFILEGCLTAVVGIFVFFFLPSYPEQASWLTPEEKRLQRDRLGINAGQSEEKKLNWAEIKDCLTTWRLYVHYLIYMGAGVTVASLSLFSPTIVAGLGYKDLQAQLFTVPPYAVAYVVTFITAMISDHYKSRGFVAGISCVIAGVAFLIQAALPGTAYTVRYVFLIIATSGVFGGLPSLCAWVGDNVRTSTAGSLSTALNIAFSGPGQIIGVWIYRSQDKPFYRLGHAVNAAFILMSGVLSFGLMMYYRRLNKKMVGTSEQRWIA